MRGNTNPQKQKWKMVSRLRGKKHFNYIPLMVALFISYSALCSFNLHVATSKQLKMTTTLGKKQKVKNHKNLN